MSRFFSIMKISGFPITRADQLFRSSKDGSNTEKWQEMERWNSFRFHFKNNQVYRTFVGKEPVAWCDIPVISKADFRRYNIPLTPTVIQPPKYHLQSTSGSSGTPFSFATDYLRHAYTWKQIQHFYQTAGITLDDAQARLYGIPQSFSKRLKERTKDFITNRYRFPLLDLSDKHLEKWTIRFQQNRYNHIYGYAFPLINYARYLKKQEIVLKHLAPRLKACIITAEMCTPEEHHLLEETFGIPVFNEYGNSEMGIIGFGPTNRWQIAGRSLYLEILDDKGLPLPEGKEGRVVCTLFFNQGTPFVRYDTGDIAAVKTIDGTRYITRLIGRQESMMLLPSGRKVPGDTFFHYLFSEYTNSHDLIEHFKVIQKAKDLFHIQMVTSREMSPLERNTLETMIVKQMNEKVRIEIERVQEIKRSKGGKFQRFVSEVE